MKRKVIFVTRTLFPLAETGQWINWATVLRDSGWEVVVVVLETPQSLSSLITLDNIQLVRMTFRSRELQGWRRLREFLLSEQADVLHFWDCPAGLWWLARRFPGPIFETRVRNGGRQSTRWLRRRLRRSDLLLAFDQSLLDRAADLGRRSALIHKFPLHVDQSREAVRVGLTKEFGIPADSILVSAAARLLPETHCKDLIWAVDLLACIRDDVYLFLMGSGAQRERLKRFARQTEVATRIRFLESPANGANLVAASDVFWQADLSAYQPEGALVAMAHRVPLIAVHGPAMRSLLLPQQTALPIRLGGREQLARWTKFVLELPERRAQLVEQAQRHLGREFPYQKMRQSIAQAYELSPAEARVS